MRFNGGFFRSLVREKAERQNITIKEFYEANKIAPSVVSMACGGVDIRISTLSRLARAVGVDASDLLMEGDTHDR